MVGSVCGVRGAVEQPFSSRHRGVYQKHDVVFGRFVQRSSPGLRQRRARQTRDAGPGSAFSAPGAAAPRAVPACPVAACRERIVSPLPYPGRCCQHRRGPTHRQIQRGQPCVKLGLTSRVAQQPLHIELALSAEKGRRRWRAGDGHRPPPRPPWPSPAQNAPARPSGDLSRPPSSDPLLPLPPLPPIDNSRPRAAMRSKRGLSAPALAIGERDARPQDSAPTSWRRPGQQRLAPQRRP